MSPWVWLITEIIIAVPLVGPARDTDRAERVAGIGSAPQGRRGRLVGLQVLKWRRGVERAFVRQQGAEMRHRTEGLPTAQCVAILRDSVRIASTICSSEIPPAAGDAMGSAQYR